MGSPVPRLLTEVQVSVGRRGCRLRGNRGEKTTFWGMQVKSRSIPKAGHAHGQSVSQTRPLLRPLRPLSACRLCPSSFSCFTTVRGVDERAAPSPVPPPYSPRAHTLYLFPFQMFVFTQTYLPTPSVSSLITSSLPHFCCLPSDTPMPPPS